jgi:hypothetical protein
MGTLETAVLDCADARLEAGWGTLDPAALDCGDARLEGGRQDG